MSKVTQWASLIVRTCKARDIEAALGALPMSTRSLPSARPFLMLGRDSRTVG